MLEMSMREAYNIPAVLSIVTPTFQVEDPEREAYDTVKTRGQMWG